MASFLQPTYSGWNKAVPLTLSGLCVCVCVCACARAHVCVLLDTRALSILGWWEVGGPGRLPRRPATWRLSLGPPTCSHPADAQPSGGPGAALLSPLPRQGQGPSTPRRGCTASRTSRTCASFREAGGPAWWPRYPPRRKCGCPAWCAPCPPLLCLPAWDPGHPASSWSSQSLPEAARGAGPSRAGVQTPPHLHPRAPNSLPVLFFLPRV